MSGSEGKLVLELQGVVPAFKNRKRISGNQLVTDKAVKARMDEMISSIESQLLCALQHATGGTLTAAQARSLIRSWLPADDCWTCLPELHVTAKLSSQDDVGATITIERI